MMKNTRQLLWISALLCCGLLFPVAAFAEETPAAVTEAQEVESSTATEPAIATDEDFRVPSIIALPSEHPVPVPADVCSSDSHTECIGKENGASCGRLKICVMSEGSRDCTCQET